MDLLCDWTNPPLGNPSSKTGSLDKKTFLWETNQYGTVHPRCHCSMQQKGDSSCIRGVGVSPGASLYLFPGVQCYETETGYRCGPCPAGYTGTYALKLNTDDQVIVANTLGATIQFFFRDTWAGTVKFFVTALVRGTTGGYVFTGVCLLIGGTLWSLAPGHFW